ncbi:hypothetical protein [Pontibacter sp. H249]|uniref:hypothetical protein n=1 Tax=Pontibacter sp. H249 TaxID=3133420 RepID=UPI0030C4A352
MENNRISRKELYQQVWSEPMTTLARKYSVSDFELRKLCKKWQVPTPRQGYWQSFRAGKQVPIPTLPDLDSEEQEIDLATLTEPKAAAPLSPLELLQLEIERSLQKVLQVPAKLTNPDKLIAATKANIEQRNVTYRFTELLTTSYGFLDMKISRQSLNRAFRLMDTLIKALRARGHSVMISGSQACIHIRQEKYEVAIREKLKRSDEIRPKSYSYDYTPTGILFLRIGPTWNGREWQDGKVPLESRLSAVIAYLEWRTQKEEEWHIACKKAEEVRRDKERVLREQQLRKEQELSKFKVLLQQAKRWHEVQMLRNYLAAVDQHTLDNENLHQEHREWLSWAQQKADWYDPLINLPDDLLHEVDKETLTLPNKHPYY